MTFGRIDRAKLLKIGAAGVIATELRLNSPSVAITGPAAGSTVSGTIPVTATYSGPGFRLANLSVDGTQVASTSTQPIAFSLDTSRYPDGTHTLGVQVEYRKAKQFQWTEASLQLGIRGTPIITPPGSVVYTADGTVLAAKTWNDGLTPPLYDPRGYPFGYDAEGWQGPNAYDAIVPGTGDFGHFTLDSTTKDEGAYSAQFFLPADTANLRTIFLSQYTATKRAGTHEYFSDAVRVPSGWPGQGAGNPQGLNLWESNAFVPYSGALFGRVGFWSGQLSLINVVIAGLCDARTGSVQYNSGTPGLTPSSGMPGPLYVANPMEYDTWYQHITHVYWSFNTDGVVEAWVRRRNKDSDFTKVFSYTGFPTLQWGYDFNGTYYAQGDNNISPTERLCTYTGGDSVTSFVWRDSYSRCSTFNTAASRFGTW